MTAVVRRVPPPPPIAVQTPEFNRWLLDLTAFISPDGGIDVGTIPGWDTMVSTVALHTQEIATNTANIAQNAANIASNTTAISNNTAAIAANTVNITKKVNRSGDTMTGILTLYSDPVNDMDAVTKHYVDGQVIGAIEGGYSKTQADARFTHIAGDTMTGILTLSGNPVNPLDAATKFYVDNQTVNAYTKTQSDARYVAIAGSTMTGTLTLNQDPTASLQAATKNYVDTHVSGTVGNYVNKAGDTMTGFLTLNADPTASLQAATKNYVDTHTSGVAGNYVLKTGDTMTGKLTTNQLAYTRAIDISGQDLNTITTAGFYNGSSLGNAPDGSWYYVEVQTHSNAPSYCLQILTHLTANPAPMYWRTEIGGTWYAWQRIASTAYALYKGGDSMSGALTTAASGSQNVAGSVNSIMVLGNSSDWASMSFLSQGVFGANFGLNPNGNFYIGGWSYGTGTNYQVWTSRDGGQMVQNSRLAYAGDLGVGWQWTNGAYHEPYGGAVITTCAVGLDANNNQWPNGFRYRYLQVQVQGGGWATVGLA